MNKRSGGGGSWNRRGKPSNKELTGMRRQRSLEWRNERDCSSSDEEIVRPVESQIFASLLAQAQKEFKDDIERNYRSDDTEEVVTTDNPTSPFPTPPPTLVSPRSPIPLHRQASPFPLENINARRINYQPPPERLRTVNALTISKPLEIWRNLMENRDNDIFTAGLPKVILEDESIKGIASFIFSSFTLTASELGNGPKAIN